MPTYALSMKHPASNLFWDTGSKIADETSPFKKEIAKKHNIRNLGALDQVTFYIVDAPSQKEIVEYLKEIGISFNKNIFIQEIPRIENR